MKNFIKNLMWLLVMCLSALPASAYDFEVDGIYYDIISLEDLTCKVTYDSKNSITKYLEFYYGSNGQSHSDWIVTTYPSYSGDIVIPAKVNYKGRELSVTGIGERAFLNCTALTSLTLPSSISNIEQYTINSNNYCYAGAFDYCGIESLTVGNAYTLTRFNQTYAYYNNNTTKGNLKHLNLSDDFSGIINVDFSKYTKLVSIQSNSINVPEFSSGTHFTNNQYLNLLVNVPDSALSQYKEMQPWSLFWDIVSINDPLTPPSQLQSYDFVVNDIYYDIVSLNDLTCKVTYDSKNSTTKYLEFYYGSNGQSHSDWIVTTYPSYGGDIVIPAKVNYKGRELSVTGIGERAFLNCTALTSLTLPSSISNIEQYTINSNNYCYAGAFDYCGIESLTVGNAYTLTRFNQTYAYYNNNTTKGNLKYLNLSDNFSGIINVDFSKYTKLASIQSNSINVPEFSSGTHFTNEQYLNLEVLVPEDAYSAYQAAVIWKDFWELTAMKSVKSIILNETSLSLEPKQTIQLTPTILPEDAFDSSVIWSSSNPSVATVDENGIVTAVTKGDAVITVYATDGSGVYANCDVHVDLLVKEIKLSETEIGLEPGSSKNIEFTLYPSDAFVKDVVWSSEDENVASVDQNGNVTANNIGVTNINVSTTDGSNLTATCKVTVAELVKSINVSPSEATINEGETIQLTCVVKPETATYKEVVWSSEDEDVATVDSEGIVMAVSSGSVKIKAIASDGSNVYGESMITVDAVTLEAKGICYQRNSLSTLKIVANTDLPYSGDFIIPTSVIIDGQEMPITEIGTDAFTNCDNLTSIVIPNIIKKIKEPSFAGCSKLEYVKICDGSALDNNLDNLFPDSPIKELYIGSDALTYNSDSRILGIVKSMSLGSSISTFPPADAFKSLKSFIVEDSDFPIIEPEDYCTSSSSLINRQEIRDTYTYIYYRFFYLITYTHLSPILTALQNNVLDYIHIGREIECIEVDTSKTQEKIPTTAGSRYQEYGYYDEVNYQYQEIIAKSDYNRYPTEKLSFEKQEIELKVGDSVKLVALFTPSNAACTTLEWSSSDESKVVVDIFGNVRRIAEGEAEITATTTDGSNLSASCWILDEGAGVNSVIIDNTNDFDVYNLQGIRMNVNTKEELSRLPNGIYIVNGHKVYLK